MDEDMECLICCQEGRGVSRVLSLDGTTVSGFFCEVCYDALLREEWISVESESGETVRS